MTGEDRRGSSPVQNGVFDEDKEDKEPWSADPSDLPLPSPRVVVLFPISNP